MRRLHLALSGAELEPLVSHVDSDVATDVNDFLTVYNYVPEEIRYSGDMYRGVRITHRDVGSFFNNEVFVTKDMKEDRIVESWSVDYKIAEKFARVGLSLITPIGVVIKSNTDRLGSSIVMELTPPVIEFLRKRAYEDLGVDPNEEFDYGSYPEVREVDDAFRYINSFSDEQEIIVRNLGQQTYALCQDVIYVVVAGKIYSSDSEFKDMVNSRIDDESLSILDMNPVYFEKGLIHLDCNGGDLTLHNKDTVKKRLELWDESGWGE